MFTRTYNTDRHFVAPLTVNLTHLSPNHLALMGDLQSSPFLNMCRMLLKRSWNSDLWWLRAAKADATASKPKFNIISRGQLRHGEKTQTTLLSERIPSTHFPNCSVYPLMKLTAPGRWGWMGSVSTSIRLYMCGSRLLDISQTPCHREIIRCTPGVRI